MKQTTIIQRTKAIFLLLVLAVGIAPKAFFHDLVANHKDLPSCNQHHKTAVFHYQEYNCHFDDLVVTTPFLFENDQPIDFALFHFGERQNPFLSFCLPTFSLHKENRGPPAA